LFGDGSLAYLTHVLVNDADTSAERRSEFIAHAYGPHGSRLAEQLAAAVRSWDQRVRDHGYPQLAVYPTRTNVRRVRGTRPGDTADLSSTGTPRISDSAAMRAYGVA
jgi:protein-L-isoaspartate(D-aspartate) O-methyltransferase